MFMPCDKAVHVGGYVRDQAGIPMEGARVTFYGVTHETDKSGCFYFGGVLATSYFGLDVRREGFKPYIESSKEFAYYDVGVTLQPIGTATASKGVWRPIGLEETTSTPSCF